MSSTACFGKNTMFIGLMSKLIRLQDIHE